MAYIQPKDGFDWSLLKWAGPNERQPKACSYCAADIDEESVPLMLWREDGSCAVFCDQCGTKWWGFSND